MINSKKWRVHALSIGISLVLMVAVYSVIDLGAFAQVWAELHYGWLAWALVATVPLFALTIWRLRVLSPAPVGWGLGCRVNAQASAMNIIAPAKLGEIGKCVFLAQHSKTPVSSWFTLCLFEKMLDLATLLAWCTLGLLLAPALALGFRLAAVPVGGAALGFFVALAIPALALGIAALLTKILPHKLAQLMDKLAYEWQQLTTMLHRNPRRLVLAVGSTIVLWAGHLLQIWLLAKAVGLGLDLWTMLALVPLALVIGLFPFTLAGIGTRDAAFVALLGAYANPAAAAALGLLVTFRYILPILAGLPLLAIDITAWRKALKKFA
jgi:uncharacterized protein (TIRG00374 family)